MFPTSPDGQAPVPVELDATTTSQWWADFPSCSCPSGA
jgi:hypothetical protein